MICPSCGGFVPSDICPNCGKNTHDPVREAMASTSSVDAASAAQPAPNADERAGARFLRTETQSSLLTLDELRKQAPDVLEHLEANIDGKTPVKLETRRVSVKLTPGIVLVAVLIIVAIIVAITSRLGL